jgi:hypothetical protein
MPIAPHLLTGFAFALILAIAPLVRAGDSDWYIRQSTWHETVLSSLEALARSDLKDGFAPYEGATLRGGELAQKVSIPVAGAQELYLFVTGIPDVKWAVADWADARLVRKDDTAEWISQSNRTEVLLGRCERDLTLKSGLYQKLRLNGRMFDRGVNVQANSILRVPLDGEFERFEAWIGVDDWAGTNGSVRFSVMGARSAARKQLFELVARDFAEGGPRREMAWEREDRIFEFDWNGSDWAVLAERYTKACDRVPPWAQRAHSLAGVVKNRSGLGGVRALYLQCRT